LRRWGGPSPRDYKTSVLLYRMCSLLQNIADSMAALGVSKSQRELIEMVRVRKQIFSSFLIFLFFFSKSQSELIEMVKVKKGI
jgi:hypothetical protein